MLTAQDHKSNAAAEQKTSMLTGNVESWAWASYCTGAMWRSSPCLWKLVLREPALFVTHNKLSFVSDPGVSCLLPRRYVLPYLQAYKLTCTLETAAG
jgi:hypothetical protein